MTNIDSLEDIKKLDKENVYGSVTKMASQVKQAWEEVSGQDIPKGFSNVDNIIIAGMGGSALGGKLIQFLYKDELKVPIEIITDYSLPGYANNNTLVISSSYSGNTEESISCLQKAIEKKTQIYVVTTGGKSAEIAIEHKLPSYIFDPKYNPSGQPRMANAYSTTAMLALLAKANLISVKDKEIGELVQMVETLTREFGVGSTDETNLAKQTAKDLMGKIPILVSSEHLYETVHTFKNQLNETAKVFSAHFAIPELNHHLMEGLRYPEQARNILHFLFFESHLYFERVSMRYPITQEVLKKNSISFSSYKLKSKTKLAQAFEILTFGSFVQFYLAMLYGHDPAPVPMVDFFKKELAKG